MLDTGADCPVIHSKNVPREIKQHPCYETAIAALGNRIVFKERAENLEATIDGKMFKFDLLITETAPKDTIIGADTLIKYPDLLGDILREKNRNLNSIMNISL